MGLMITIVTLLKISQESSGFVSLGGPPSFLAANPDLDRAIWVQGLQYTALPTFLMGVYRSLWDGLVAAMARRQPYVELRKQKGGSSSKTLLLGYESEQSLVSMRTALKNRHFYLLLCMVSSLLLALAVPCTAFLFTPTSFSAEYAAAARVTSEFNGSAFLLPSPDLPDIRTPLDAAAAVLMLGAQPWPWTSRSFAFPSFGLEDATSYIGQQAASQAIPITTNITAYVTLASCRILRGGVDYDAIPFRFVPDMFSLHIVGKDRGCEFETVIDFDTTSPGLDSSITASSTLTCTAEAGWSRIAVVAGRYIGDVDRVHPVSDLSVISCAPSYWAVPGSLSASVSPMDTDDLGTPPVPVIDSFVANWGDASEAVGIPHMYFEYPLMDAVCRKGSRTVTSNNEFSRHVFQLASQNISKDKPLDGEALLSATTSIFEMTYALLAVSTLFQPLKPALIQPAIAMVSETRLIVVAPMAYMITAVLTLVACLTLGAFFYVKQESALFEEPIGLISVAGIVNRSRELQDAISRLTADEEFVGDFRKTAMRSEDLMKTRWRYSPESMNIKIAPPEGTPFHTKQPQSAWVSWLMDYGTSLQWIPV
jgi:hypothetical protein